MKLIEKNTGRKVEILMYMVDEDKIPSQEDISADIFDASTEGANDEGEWFVADVDDCIDFAKDWVDGIGDFADEDGFHVTENTGYRMAEINGELYTNYDI